MNPKLPKPKVKLHLAVNFNEIVQYDLFFLWDHTFMLLIDEAMGALKEKDMTYSELDAAAVSSKAVEDIDVPVLLLYLQALGIPTLLPRHQAAADQLRVQ